MGLPLPAGPPPHAGPPTCRRAWDHYRTRGRCYADVRSAAVAAIVAPSRAGCQRTAALSRRCALRVGSPSRRRGAAVSFSPSHHCAVAHGATAPSRRPSGGFPLRRAITSSSVRQPSPSCVVPLPPPHLRAVMRGAATHLCAVVHGAVMPPPHPPLLRCRARSHHQHRAARRGNAVGPCQRSAAVLEANFALSRHHAVALGAATATEPPLCCAPSRRGPAVALTGVGLPSRHRAVLSRAAATPTDYRAVA